MSLSRKDRKKNKRPFLSPWNAWLWGSGSAWIHPATTLSLCVLWTWWRHKPWPVLSDHQDLNPVLTRVCCRDLSPIPRPPRLADVVLNFAYCFLSHMSLGTRSALAGRLTGILPLFSALIKLTSESRKDLMFASILPLALQRPRQLASHTSFAPGSAKLY